MDSLPSSTSGSARSWANGGNGSPVRTGRDLCRRCGEVVYAAESVCLVYFMAETFAPLIIVSL